MKQGNGGGWISMIACDFGMQVSVSWLFACVRVEKVDTLDKKHRENGKQKTEN